MKKGVGTLSPKEVSDIHDRILKDSGGLPGRCPDKSLEAVLYIESNIIYYMEILKIFMRLLRCMQLQSQRAILSMMVIKGQQ